ncbi:Rid family hydrolase [Mesorhizobium sp. M0293]|uniref:Rid family hydrolase n=1 Tax=Mesorhizobium sp. M0293 TaxID=2956930 RepID=UPI00333BF6F5
MNSSFPIERTPGVAPGRSSGSAFGNLVWAVATSDDKTLDLKGQIEASFSKIEGVLALFRTDKRYLISVNVLLADLEQKIEFDVEWRAWVGDDPDHWPQRCCFQALLSAGTLVEITVVAARPS